MEIIPNNDLHDDFVQLDINECNEQQQEVSDVVFFFLFSNEIFFFFLGRRTVNQYSFVNKLNSVN
jgi:hypothetical protein